MADKKICHFYKKNLIKFCDLKKMYYLCNVKKKKTF